MAFVDELTIRAKAGDGGDGVVRWLHLKGKEYSGPAGGNGGDGGDVYVRAVADLNLLARYRGAKRFEAGNGEDGHGKGKHGRRGDDLYIAVPAGSVIQNRETGEEYELLHTGETQLVLKGGRGGVGNAAFKSSVNRSPTQATAGSCGEAAVFHIELRLIADAGLVGLPNAGKTSLLNALTKAAGKVGSYAFTTLDPNLGALHGLVIADIPGLIEGASQGKGLGIKFLRHIARTRLILHCVPLDSDDPLRDYMAVRKELVQFEDGALAQKPEVVVLTKADTQDTVEVTAIAERFRKEGKEVYAVSILDGGSVKRLREVITSLLR